MNKFLRSAFTLLVSLAASTLTAQTTPATLYTEEAVESNWTTTGNEGIALNTWSTENDASGIKTPFVQVWVGAGKQLSDAKIAHKQITGLAKGSYVINLLARAFNEGNTTDFPTGITFYANNKTVDLDSIGTKSIYDETSAVLYAEISLKCKVDESGTLDFGFDVSNTTADWLAWKNLEIIYNYNSSYIPVLTPVTGKMGKDAAINQADILEEYRLNPNGLTYVAALEAIEQAKRSVAFYAPIAALDKYGLAEFAYKQEFNDGTLDETADYTKEIIAATLSQMTSGSDLTYVLENSNWDGSTGTYKTATEKYSSKQFKSTVSLFQSLYGILPGKYKLDFYAVANTANISAASGAGIAQIFVNDSTKDIEVFEQNECEPTDYLHSFEITISENGILEYGIQNIAEGGNWYVIQPKSLTLVRIDPSCFPAEHVVMKYSSAATSYMTAANNAARLNLDAKIWTVTAEKGYASNFPRLDSKTIRLYYNEDGGNSITVSNEDLIIDSIRIAFNNGRNNCSVIANNTTAEQKSENSYKINSTSFEIYNNCSEMNTQVRIDSIMIFYYEMEYAELGTAKINVDFDDTESISFKFPDYKEVISKEDKLKVTMSMRIGDDDSTLTEEYNATEGIAVPTAMFDSIPAGTSVQITILPGEIKLYDAYDKKVAENKDTVYVEFEIPEQKLIANSTFGKDAAVTSIIRTYAKDMTSEEETFGMSEISKWTIAENGNARAAGIFEYGSEAGLGSETYTAPAEAPEGSNGKALGIVAVWGGMANYTQEIILPAGVYEITIPVFNKEGDTAFKKNLNGFIANNGTEYLSKKTSFTVGEWENDVITISLKEETTGVISIGYEGADAGSQVSQHLFFDRIDIQAVSNISALIADLNDMIDNIETEIATYTIGEKLFTYPDSDFTSIRDALDKAKNAVADADATDASIISATNDLKSAYEAFAPKMNMPKEGQPYIVSNTTAEGNISVADSKVSVEEGAYVYFTAVDGGFVISGSTGEYVFKTTTNTWTLNSTTNIVEAYVINFNVVEGGYTIQGEKGLFGTDATTEGATIYANKTADKNGIWNITEYIAPDAVADIETKENKSIKSLANGKLIITRNGKQYKVSGVRAK